MQHGQMCFSIEDGKVTLEEVLKVGEESKGSDDPVNWTKERIRHDMEEKRKAIELQEVDATEVDVTLEPTENLEPTVDFNFDDFIN